METNSNECQGPDLGSVFSGLLEWKRPAVPVASHPWSGGKKVADRQCVL